MERSLGLGKTAKWIAKWMNLLSIRLFGDTMFVKMFGPAAGEKLHAEQEFDNLMDKFAVKVTKNSKTVGHTPREFSRISWYFCGGKKRVEVTGRRLHSKQLYEY